MLVANVPLYTSIMSIPFKVHILGSSAAIPTSTRLTSSQLVNYHNKYLLIDCAEGTQMQLRRFRLPMMKINHIFISHLHGDHYLGLPGLIFSMHLLGRTKKLHLYSPPGMKEIIELQYSISKLEPGFDIQYHIITRGEQLLYSDNHISIHTIEMLHRLPAYGFLIKEKPSERNIDKKAIEQFNIPIDDIPAIKRGKDFQSSSGEWIANEKITLPPPLPRVYACCSDTGYTEQYLDEIAHADLLYHEATFLSDKADIARQKTHCTALQAATIASKCKAKKLMIGHYSARYDELSLFLEEARAVFQNTIMAEEGRIVEIEHDSNPQVD